MKKRYKVLLLKRIGQISKYDNNYGRKDEPEWFVQWHELKNNLVS